MRRTFLVAPLLALVLAGCTTAQGGPEPQTVVSEHRTQTEATRAIAQAFLTRYLIEHDVAGAYVAYAHPDFIQHDPNMADGVAGHRAYFSRLAQQGGGPSAQAHVSDMLLVDGDTFALMHHGFRGPDDTGRIFVDLWRVEDGLIAEHWDVIQPLVADMPHGNGMGCGNVETHALATAHRDSIMRPTCEGPDRSIGRDVSLQAYADYTGSVAGGDVLAAIERWFHPAYRQHSPVIADGKQGAIDYLMAEWGRPDAPLPVLGPQRIVAEGDLVLVHYMYHLEGQPDEAHVDIFRFTDGLISEHWDLKQPVPETSANTNGMW